MAKFEVVRHVFHSQIAQVEANSKEEALEYAIANEGALEWYGDPAGTEIDVNNVEEIE